MHLCEHAILRQWTPKENEEDKRDQEDEGGNEDAEDKNDRENRQKGKSSALKSVMIYGKIKSISQSDITLSKSHLRLTYFDATRHSG